MIQSVAQMHLTLTYTQLWYYNVTMGTTLSTVNITWESHMIQSVALMYLTLTYTTCCTTM